MPSLHGVMNHFNYIRSNWTLVTSAFLLMLSGMFVAGSVIQAGGNALAYYGGVNDSNSYRENGGYPAKDSNGGYPVKDQNGGYPLNRHGEDRYQKCHTHCHQHYRSKGPSLSPSPCPWWNSSYNCPHPSPSPTPCPWWNNSYKCRWNPTPSGTNYQQYGKDYYENGGYPIETYSPTITNTPTPTPIPSPTESPVPVTAESNGRIENNNNSSATATANVVVSGYKNTGHRAPAVSVPAPTVYAAPTVSASPVVTQLPETGTPDSVMNTLGLGSLVAASVAYLSSRKELLRTPFHK